MSGGDLVSWLQQLSRRAVMTIVAGLVVVGLALPLLVPENQGWISLLTQTRPLFWGLALFVVASAGVGAIRRQFDHQRFDSYVTVEELTWQEFEGYLAEYFRRRGAKVTYRGGSAADGGVDLVLEDASGRRLVQAKHWRSRNVDVGRIRELWGVVQHEHADGAVFVTSGTYTRDALRFAEGKSLELIDGDRLRRLAAEIKSATSSAAANARD